MYRMEDCLVIKKGKEKVRGPVNGKCEISSNLAGEGEVGEVLRAYLKVKNQ